ncbi:TPA: helix-turn-helix transcriptional regulator, partial [Streptococcus suis]|nr:helix-turn-helix transcriptional regulator [Streptococcus suis]
MNRLKELRQEKKLSQKELAKKIGVHYRTLQNWENGESQIKPDKAQALA